MSPLPNSYVVQGFGLDCDCRYNEVVVGGKLVKLVRTDCGYHHEELLRRQLDQMELFDPQGVDNDETRMAAPRATTFPRFFDFRFPETEENP